MKRTRIPLVEHPNPTAAGTYTADGTGQLTQVSTWARINPAASESPPQPAPEAPTPNLESEANEPAPKKSRKAAE